MSFANEQSQDEVMSEINMTPFVDIMLVLLIIFMVTLPLVHQSVEIQLPKTTSQRLDDSLKPIRIGINTGGEYYWNKDKVDSTQIDALLAAEKQNNPSVTILLYADKDAKYELIAQLISSIQRAGLGKIGFISETKGSN